MCEENGASFAPIATAGSSVRVQLFSALREASKRRLSRRRHLIEAAVRVSRSAPSGDSNSTRVTDVREGHRPSALNETRLAAEFSLTSKADRRSAKMSSGSACLDRRDHKQSRFLDPLHRTGARHRSHRHGFSRPRQVRWSGNLCGSFARPSPRFRHCGREGKGSGHARSAANRRLTNGLELTQTARYG